MNKKNLKEELFYKKVEIEKLQGKLKEIESALRLHTNIVSALSHSRDLKSDLESLLSNIKENYKLDEIALLLYNEETGLLDIYASSGLSDEKKEKTFLPGEGISGEAFREGKIIEVERAGKDPRFKHWGVPSHIYLTKSFIAIPIIIDSLKIGVLSVTADAITPSLKNVLFTLINSLIPILNLKMEKERQEGIFFETLIGILDLIESMSPFFKGHSQRVARYARFLAEKLKLPKNEMDVLSKGSLLHDIGKIGLIEIAIKRGKLTSKEMEKMKEHPLIGEKFMRKFEFLKDTIPMIKYHHERIDGKGYPGELSGNEIPLLVRIVSISDVYDAITSARPYRRERPFKYAIEEMKKVKGSQLDAQLVDVFISDLKELKELTYSLKSIF
jgi:putative nucleotidyltransferase with HDIG domain